MTVAEAVTPSQDSRLFPFRRRLAPPWLGSWQRFRSATPAGTWTAVSINWQGAIVAQMGAQPAQQNAPPTQATLLVVYRREIEVEHGVQDWEARIEPVAVSLHRPGDSAVDVWAFLQVRKPGNNFLAIEQLRNNQPRVLRTGSSIILGQPVPAGRYELRAGIALLMSYRGFDRPYCEGIANVPYVDQWGPPRDPIEPLPLAAADAGAGREEVLALLERSTEELLGEAAPADGEPPVDTSHLVELEG